MTRYAILAVGVLLPIVIHSAVAQSPPPAETGTAAESSSEKSAPIRVSFRLATGLRVTGDLTHWDDDGIDGSFARRLWTEIDYEDVWRLRRRLIDEDAPHDWVDTGRTLLHVAEAQPKAAKWAERAFRFAARKAGKDTEAVRRAVDDARAEVDNERRLRAELAAAVEAQRLLAGSPEARDWGAYEWPTLSIDEQRAATETMRRDAARILARAGLDLEPVETDYFLFYSDMPRRETAKWAGELDLMYAKLAEQFRLPRGENIFWGKAAIFVFRQRDRFRLVEAEAFGQVTAGWEDGFCHPQGPRVFVNFYRQKVDERFAAILVHETVHGFMHRYRTPLRLPTWANEGFADYLADTLFRNSPIGAIRRSFGLDYVRRGRVVDPYLDMDYGDPEWPGPDSIGYSLGYMLVDLMIRDRPEAFRAWVDAIKDGKPWEQALEEDFGVTREKLVESFVRFYKVND